ncbi:DUF6127 family protein [Mesorhizobium sp. A623]
MAKLELDVLLARAVETGARCALQEMGLDGKDAPEDIRDCEHRLDTTIRHAIPG